jgi:hypothetical protein
MMPLRPRDYDRRAGKSEDLERSAWAERFRLSERRRLKLTNKLMRQLCLCRSDDARRVILGIGEKL